MVAETERDGGDRRGVVHLRKISSLTTLELAKTKVTDAGLKHLAGLKGLSHLTIEGSGVTKAAVASLESTMPQLRVAPGVVPRAAR